jgi:hypothetical protein
VGKSGSMRTVPVNQSLGPWADGCAPARVIFIVASSLGDDVGVADHMRDSSGVADGGAAAVVTAAGTAEVAAWRASHAPSARRPSSAQPAHGRDATSVHDTS